MRIDSQERALADIVQLVEVEESSAAGHLLSCECKIIGRCIRVFCSPFLVVGVEDGEEILATIDDDDEYENIAEVFENEILGDIDYDGESDGN